MELVGDFLNNSQICKNINSSNALNIQIIDLENKTTEESIEHLRSKKNDLENESVLIVDNFHVNNLDYFAKCINLKPRVGKVLDSEKLPYSQEEIMNPGSENYFKNIFENIDELESFEVMTNKLINELVSLIKTAFPSYKISSDSVIAAWRFYPVAVGSLHVDEFKHASDRQVLRLFINLDHKPRFLCFGSSVWNVIDRFGGYDLSWPDNVADCVSFFQNNFLKGKLGRYKIDVDTVLLKSGSFWLGNPASFCHCAVLGFKGLAIDFEYDCESIEDPSKSFLKRWENILKKKML